VVDTNEREWVHQRLEGRTALVTGAGREGGIGAAIARRLAVEGARVAIADIDLSGATSLSSDIPQLTLLEVDVGSRRDVEKAVAILTDEWGKIDILVNNASVGEPTGSETWGEEIWDRVFRVNVMGAVWCSEAVLPGMKARRRGKIVTVSSIAAHSARGTAGPYAVSKAAVLRFTKGLALEVAPFLINVNAVCPGAVWTRLQEDAFSEPAMVDPKLSGLEPEEAFRIYYRELCPLGVQEAGDVAAAVAFLVSEDAAKITGQCLHVDGGAIRW
jgi:NAD(P)-dependent dehydrogenase (short-subunit alcohol dehydrogenase family)